MKILQSETPVESENVFATFKGDKIVNIEANETVKKNNLDIRINHLFGNIGKESGGGIHNFYGLDQSADIRIGLHYGITDRLMVGLAREKRNENFEGLAKYRLLQQTTDNKIPFAITVFGNMTYSIKEDPEIDKNINRITYCTQMVIARKFSTKFSFAAVPAFIHRNFVPADDENNTFSLSGGLRLKVTRSTSFVADYSHTFGRQDLIEKRYDVVGIGCEIETGGHVFSMMLSNASGCIANDYLLNTQDSWSKGGFKFGFIISRMLRFNKVEEPVKKSEY
jgi:hypothetical protein